MNYTRNELLLSEATMNQMRNAIYHLQRFLKINGISEIRERMRRMGRNIAHTYVRYWKPIDFINESNVKDVIATIYKNILNSNVSIELDSVNTKIVVKDNDCPLCKYHFEDIDTAGCEIIVAMVAEFINLINKESKDSSSISLQHLNIETSRTFGNKACIQNFIFKVGGN
ncbi:MAG: hypothetical protein ACFE85_04585 [Candidatus Hodarchaeota archaeon]